MKPKPKDHAAIQQANTDRLKLDDTKQVKLLRQIVADLAKAQRDIDAIKDALSISSQE
jgi:hypothetical protein